MGSSARKKAEKKKDFQKTKLKVGKQKPKASNVTDTSFKSKGIVLRDQSLTISAPGTLSQVTHHLALLSSRADNQRKDSLSFIANQLSSRSIKTPLPLSSTTLVAKLLPLSLDGAQAVRLNLLKVLRAFRGAELSGQAESILLHARAGLTHMSVGVRETALDLVSIALGTIPDELVSCPGGWIKTLRYFAMLLGWPVAHGSDSGSVPKMHLSNSIKLTVRGLDIIGQYIEAGLEVGEEFADSDQSKLIFPLFDTHLHLLPRTGDAFAHLGFFRAIQSDNVAFQDRTERQSSLQRSLRGLFEMQLAKSKREGGEIGRAAAQVQAVIFKGMADFEEAQL